MTRALPTVGTRVRMVGVMENDPNPIPVGDEGEVTFVGHGQFGVAWESGRRLMCLAEDPYEVVVEGG